MTLRVAVDFGTSSDFFWVPTVWVIDSMATGVQYWPRAAKPHVGGHGELDASGPQPPVQLGDGHLRQDADPLMQLLQRVEVGRRAPVQATVTGDQRATRHTAGAKAGMPRLMPVRTRCRLGA